MVSQAGLGSEPAFHVPEYDTLRIVDLPLFIVLGLVCGVASSALLSLITSAEASFLRLRRSGVTAAAFPVLGGLACGSVAMLYPEVRLSS
jgi:H+/Cl- antiporter ClcA